VNQDGIQFSAPAVFDELIQKQQMPITIGVFVMHGKVKALTPDALDRFNRSYEYDGLGDGYARFLIAELLPEVERKTATDGRPMRLSRDPNDRTIGGSSSGAICAFTAAWERPDAFRRGFSSIGTYVGPRGGNDYPTLIRKTEPKPIRIFLEDGVNDLNIYGDDWWMAIQEMERALTFAGYEVNHAWGSGGHDHKHATEIFPEAMKWLWKDWPAPVKAGSGSQQLQEILIPGEGWKPVPLVEGHHVVPHLIPSRTGEVFFADMGDLYRVGLDGRAVSEEGFLVPQPSKHYAFGPDGQLYASTLNSHKLIKLDESGKSSAISLGFDPASAIVRHDGKIYASAPSRNHSAGGRIYYIGASGQPRIVDTQGPSVGALALSPDQSLLYAAEEQSHWIYSYQIQDRGGLAHKQKYFHLHEPDDQSTIAGDLAVDRDGRLFVATSMGIQVCDQAGRVNCIIPLPGPGGRTAGVCFGGAESDTLVASSSDAIYRRKVRVKGANTFGEPIKPAPPRL
jgi:hypothetical protein